MIKIKWMIVIRKHKTIPATQLFIKNTINLIRNVANNNVNCIQRQKGTTSSLFELNHTPTYYMCIIYTGCGLEIIEYNNVRD